MSSQASVMMGEALMPKSDGRGKIEIFVRMNLEREG
jgi:hypothetical protein